ncbi:hypothetical protein [Kitasatospora aureofaciens]|uniref:hypothetical protein n=1 Tax=Kitasatospora aureofaciens TaxID=1894 RepID=UPI0033D82020
MTRIQLDDLTSDQLDELYDRLEDAENTAACLRHAVPLLRQAVDQLPVLCRYHGANLDPDHQPTWREACCDTGVPARRRRTATEALGVLAQAAEPRTRTGPSTATVSHRGRDARQPADNAVFGYIRSLPIRDAVLNAIIWRGVDAALAALGYPPGHGQQRGPQNTAAPTRTLSGHPDAPEGGHARSVSATGDGGTRRTNLTSTDTVRTPPGQDGPCSVRTPSPEACPDTDADAPHGQRPDTGPT